MRSLILLCLIVTSFLRAQDVNAFPRGEANPRILSEKTYLVRDKSRERIYKDLVLDCGDAGIAMCSISIPKKISKKGVPVVLIIAGRATGRASLELIDNHGEYALIAFEYPSVLKRLSQANFFTNFLSVKGALLDVPGQSLSILQWAQKQSWAKKAPPSVIGVSFGCFFMPPMYQMAKRNHFRLGPGVLAFGGADLRSILKQNYARYGAMKNIIAFFGAWFLDPLDPSHYLEDMDGDFLIINAKSDDEIPAVSSEKMQRLLKGNKTIYVVNGGHLYPEDSKSVQNLIKISKKWLEKQQAGK